ncbi:MAG: TPM domain-containing protein [Coriobacteriales bacterium]|nr:TPM domain-containing protein [Coriobacteriales bacterium]
MKRTHRLLVAALSLLLLTIFAFPMVAHAQTGTYVDDQMDVLSSEEFNELESMGAQYANQYGVGVYLLFTDNLGPDDSSGSGRREFLRDYYESNDLGVGNNKDGIVFGVGVNSRKYVTVKHFGNSANDPFSNDGLNDIEGNAKSELKHDNWYDAGLEYYKSAGKQLDYFANNGKQWKKVSVVGTIIKGIATLVIPLLVALGVVSGEKKAMLTARTQTEASNYVDPDSLNLRTSTDTFVNRTMSVVPIPKNDKSDNDSWHDMGGGFSGSDGGSF